MISKSSIEQLKNQTDIVDIISTLVEVKKSGANFKACCPFHGEDTPSFVISPVKQIYHCFGCGVGGDAIKFIQEYKKLTFSESIEYIANEINFSLEYESKEEKKDYANIIESINRFYISSLKDSELNYLYDRGVTKESIKTFEIGFAGESKEQIEYLKNNFLNIEEATQIGILSYGDDRIYSRLINRITFPIRNHTGKLIGFGGRTTVGHSAKYVNSIQTKLFDKSRNMYGLHLAKENIYKKGTIVITEGYLDVVMMHQAGIKTAVATMGTALTEQHIIMIKKMNCKVLLCYDGDNAGIVAANKASVLLSRSGIDGNVVLFDNGVDPADMVKDGREKELISIMKNGVPFIKFVLDEIKVKYNINDPYEKNKAKDESIFFLNSLNNPVIASEYIKYISYTLQIDTKYLSLEKKSTQPSKQNTSISKSIDEINSNKELSLIATSIDDLNAFGLLTKINSKDMFHYHKKELSMLLNGKEQELEWITLKDGVKPFLFSDFKFIICDMMIKYLNEKISSIKNMSLSFDEKLDTIKLLQKQILDCKNGVI